MEFLATTAVALVLSTGAPITDPVLIGALEESRASCHEMGGTELRYDPDLLTPVDILGRGSPRDAILSEVSAFCGPDLGPLYAGSAGGPLHAIIDGQAWPLLPGGWSIVETRFTYPGDPEAGASLRLLLVGSHGVFCDAAGAAPCVTAYGWDGARLVSILDGFAP
jgi:hypothetical protein